MEASNGQIHNSDEQPRAEEKIIIDTDPGIGACRPLISFIPVQFAGRANARLPAPLVLKPNGSKFQLFSLHVSNP
jgi:hypothetical protein